MRRHFVSYCLFFLLVFLSFCRPGSADENFSSLFGQSDFYQAEDREYLERRVGEIIKEVEQENLPSDPLILKLKEGIRKEVLPYNLVKTLENKKEAMLQAKKVMEKANLEADNHQELLLDLALSLEMSIPPEIIEEALQETIGNNGEKAKAVADSLVALLELGITPDQASGIIQKTVSQNPKVENIENLTRLVEKARREGIDPTRTAAVIEESLSKYGRNFNLVEMEVNRFIADAKSKPAIQSGQGAVTTTPGVSSPSTPVHEGGGPLESTPSSPGVPPTQEGATPLD